MNTALVQRARELISHTVVWDNHGCMPLRWNDESFLPQLERYRQSGVNAVTLNIGFGEQGVEPHVRVLAAFRHFILNRPDEYVLLETADDILRARREGKLAVGFDIEGAGGIADQPSLIQLYYDLGVRWMLMAYNRRNLVGDGVYEPENRGLTDYGAAVVAEMERVGMVVCCSHTSPRTAHDVLRRATRPVIFSHSNSKALWNHRRNIDDDLMKACADTGGVVGINGLDQFLGPNGSGVAEMVRHLDYALKLIGPEHVGLGLDYVFDLKELDDFIAGMHARDPDNPDYLHAVKFVAPEQLPEIVAGLFALGYSDAVLEKVLGGNHLRIAREVWKV